MREIKFRAWWKAAEMMVEVDKITFDESIMFLVECEDGHFEKQTVDIVDCEVMQYTGLKDKNGKEIYEGDIVNWQGVDGDETQQIIWSDFDARYMVQDPEGGQYGFGFSEAAKRMYIIGNIYENPELKAE